MARATTSFWDETSLARLAEEQGVGPVALLEHLHTTWLAEFMDEEALATILEDRKFRRAALAH